MLRKAGDPVGDCLRLLRAVHQGLRADDATTMHLLLQTLPANLADALCADDLATVQRLVLPSIQADADLAAWLGLHGVDAWITAYLSRVRLALGCNRAQ